MGSVLSQHTQGLLEAAKLKAGPDHTFDDFYKSAFVDPAAAAGGGAPPMDPAAMGGGGAPPAPPAPDPMMDQLMQRLAALEAASGSGGGAAGAGGGAQGVKPKVDVNVVLMQILKVVTRIAEHAGVVIPPSDMVPTSQDLTQLSQMSQSGNFAGAAGGGGQASAIPPIDPMGAASFPQGGGAPAGGGDGGEKQSGAQRLANISNIAGSLGHLFRPN